MKSRYSRKPRLPRIKNDYSSDPPIQPGHWNHSSGNTALEGLHNGINDHTIQTHVRLTGNSVQVSAQEPISDLEMQDYYHQYNLQDADIPDEDEVIIDFTTSNRLNVNSSARQERRREQNQKHKQNLSEEWFTRTLPRLKNIYMRERAQRFDLGNQPRGANRTFPLRSCACISPRLHSVILVRWSYIEQVVIRICCQRAADQLVEGGFFPCAPMTPSLAVDIDLLQFISIASLHMAPNVTAWGEVMEEFWKLGGYELKPKGSLRRRLQNCLFYYLQLVELAKGELDSKILESRNKLQARTSNGMEFERPSVAQQTQPFTSEIMSPDSNISSETPSHRLVDRCPACFGNKTPYLQQSAAHVIVCLDACFSHKRRNTAKYDPPFHCHDSVFLPTARVNAMEEQVATLRKDSAKTTAKAPPVSTQVLDHCERSFKAAQESSSKTSANFYDDTALMAMLCRHDRVLFVANMTSTGEKQHYALALLQALFLELPHEWKVGVLYDIGCQLDRSCRKLGLLEEFRERIIWGISVFHAYGHQWPCQLVYHPRKRSDFGFSDGEGCERYWSSLSRLVAPLRGASHHKRLFTVDLQTQYASFENLYNLSDWIGRKILNYKKRRRNALSELEGCGITISTLNEQWSLQIQAQTSETPGRQRVTVKQLVGSLLLLRSELQVVNRRGKRVRKEGEETDEEADTEQIQVKIRSLERQLGTGSQRLTLERAENDDFLKSRIKAMTIKQRLLPRLVARKFEAARLTHGNHQSIFGNKMFVNVKKSLNNREQGLKVLAQSFNREVDNMTEIKRQNRLYKNRAVPKPLDIGNLFNMDLSSSIWDNFGLEDSDDDEPPLWQSNDLVRKGITAKLELDRCREEEERLWWEMGSLCRWAIGEGQVLADSWTTHDEEDVGMSFMIVQSATVLSEVLENWRKTFSLWPWADNLLSMAMDSLAIIPIRRYKTIQTTRLTGRNETGEEEYRMENETDGNRQFEGSNENGEYNPEYSDEYEDARSSVSTDIEPLIRMSDSESDDMYY